MTRRAQGYVSVCVLVIVCFVTPPARAQQGSGLAKTTYVYRTVDGVKIEADVYRPEDKKIRPAVVWIHGGALILGSRTSVPSRIRNLCRESGYVLISIDYRLAPEVKLPAIIEDVKAAFRWIDQRSGDLLGVDTDRILVAGGSAGGYLTMMTGVCVQPKPKALVAYWGYGDVDGDWYTKPSRFYRSKGPLVPEAAARATVNKGVLTGSGGNVGPNRHSYYLFLRQHGLWTREVTGFDPTKDQGGLDEYCPVRNITPAYPPILMVHGTNDNDVPHSKSADMARELKRHGVPHEFLSVPKGGHGLGGADQDAIAAAHDRALVFMGEQLSKRP